LTEEGGGDKSEKRVATIPERGWQQFQKGGGDNSRSDNALY